MRELDGISIHHAAPMRNEIFCYRKGKAYTYKEYTEFIERKQLIKDILFITAFGTAFGVFIVVRAYAFFQYGI